ncbi:F-box only protein 15-like [Clytia hemisphaerica]|uniref:F-box only protein 15-like n=1 Tax=Clytia hemisphaerica TaxID=252671 RepID=UPI0034D5652C
MNSKKQIRIPSGKSGRSQDDEKTTKKPVSTKSKTGNASSIKRPGQTKASLRRQEIALSKKLEHTSLVPNEALHCIFKYLTYSDLLRCSCVCKGWKDVAEIQSLWHKVFRFLPKPCQELSPKAKTTGCKDWKKEALFCVKKRRENYYKKLMSSNQLHSRKKKRAEATRTLGTRWLLEIQEKGPSKPYQYFAGEDFFFSFHNLTARWNNMNDVPSLSKVKSISLYAVTPLLFDENMTPIENSICTRSLLASHSFRDHPLKSMKLVHQDKELTFYSLNQTLYFAVWSSSLPKDGDIAFVGMTTTIENLLLKTQEGSSNKVWSAPPHQVIPDDVNPSYGLHGYSVRICLRNSRKTFYENEYSFHKNGRWEDDWLSFIHQTIENPLYGDFYYDIKEQIKFSWKSGPINGRIDNLMILDVQLKDMNEELIWDSSELVLMKETEEDTDFSNYIVYEMTTEESHRKTLIRVLQDPSSKESLILSLKIFLRKSGINEWFGTKY